jgi:hypothetical protein
MTRQFNIRSEKARELAVKHARLTGKPLSQIVEEALEAFDKGQPSGISEAELWGPLLREAQAHFRKSKTEFRIEDLYDPETGLPA